MAIAFVEGQVKNATTSPAVTAAFTASIATGQLVIAYGAMDGGTTGLMTAVADSKSNTWVHVPGMDIGGASGAASLDCWYVVPTTGGTAYTVSATFTAASTNMNLIVQYFNGFVGTPTLDKVKSTDNPSAVTTITSGATAATAQAVELVVGGAVHTATVSAFSLGAGYMNLTQSSVAARQGAMESLVTAATGAQTAAFGVAAARTGLGGVVTFFDAGGAPVVGAGSTTLMMGV